MTIGMLLMGLGVACLGAVTWAAGRNADAQGTEYTQLVLATLAALAIAVTGFAFLTPSVSSLISRRSDPSQQGGILGVNQAASAMARILGPIVGLSLYMATSSHLLPYLEAACLILMMLPLVPRIRRGADAFNVSPMTPA
jgi:MFS family permease